MNQSQLTLRYAKALFDLSLEQKVLEKVKSDMMFIDQVCHENKDLRRMLHNPVINVDKKQKVMHKIFASRIDKLTLRFIDIIARKRREHYLDGIASAFVELYKDYKGIKTAHVSSPVPVMDSDRKAILSILKKLTDKSIELQEQVKEELIGGFILKMDNFQVDQSMKSKIKELKKDFEKNLYIKGF